MAFSFRVALLRGAPVFHAALKQKTSAVAAKQLFSRFANAPDAPSLSKHWQRTLKQFQGSKLNAGRTLAFTCSPLAMYCALQSTDLKSLCEQLKQRLTSSFTAKCSPCWICGPYAQLCEHGVLIKPPCCEERRKQTWVGSILSMLDAVFKQLLLCIQAFKMCILFTPVLLLYPVSTFHCKLYQLWLWVLFKAVQWSGPAYIKLGQWASTRRDLFSPSFCDKFSQLHAKVKAHSWAETEKALRQCYGKRWQETIKMDKGQIPIGSGCVAQVYKAYIHQNCIPQETMDCLSGCETLDDVYFKDGLEIQSLSDTFYSAEEDDCPEPYTAYPPNCSCLYANDPCYVPIAVKVLHPGIRERFALDLNLMNKIAWLVEFMFPSQRWVNLKCCVREFSIAMARQMDMIHEAKALKILSNDFCNNPNVRIPVPILSLVRRNILVESFEEGRPVNDFLVTPHPCDYRCINLRKKMAEIGVDAMLQMVFVKNFAHSDLHPGNIMVQNSGAFSDPCCHPCVPCRPCCQEDSYVMVDIGDTIVATPKQSACPLRLVFMDCGITATLSCEDHQKFKQLFTAIVKGHGYVVADILLEKAMSCGYCTAPCEFRHAMACCIERICDLKACCYRVEMCEVMASIFRVMHIYKVRLETNFARMIMAIYILEGLGRSLDPDLDIYGKTAEILTECK